MPKLNVKKLDSYVDAGLLTKQKHPEAELFIWNYTPECQFKRAWDKYTMMCRGLITDAQGNIVARPFKKFFNWDEPDAKYPKKSKQVDVYEKMDGSLGILYWIGDTPWIATRGSFTSEQAVVATQMFRHHLKWVERSGKEWPLHNEITLLFEIIYPENRIVVDYGRRKGLTLLAAVSPIDGEIYNPEEAISIFPLIDIPGSDVIDIVMRHPYKSLEDVLAVKPSKNREGFVIKFANGTRIKFKFEEYKRLHKLITGLSVKAIWEMLRDGKPLEEILVAVPDEFYRWVEKVANELIEAERIIREDSNMQYGDILESMPNTFDSDRDKRKFFALKANMTTYPSLSFALWDGKLDLYHELIWDLVKPKFHRVFKLSTEEA